ncbi:uncharacterized protein BKA78DRAFT_61586 [Phyllosticta capitalensis]|uniref:uncharacterized protein n=1 Tax=Phyllosticta capitalensis TaxID=121624 RepID=UPI00312FD4AA
MTLRNCALLFSDLIEFVHQERQLPALPACLPCCHTKTAIILSLSLFLHNERNGYKERKVLNSKKDRECVSLVLPCIPHPLSPTFRSSDAVSSKAQTLPDKTGLSLHVSGFLDFLLRPYLSCVCMYEVVVVVVGGTLIFPPSSMHAPVDGCVQVCTGLGGRPAGGAGQRMPPLL